MSIRISSFIWASKKASLLRCRCRFALYAETPAFEKYIDTERHLLERMFTPVDGATPIVQIKKTQDYDALQDYCHLPSETRLPYSLVFMVDGYWALRRETSLMDQTAYLNRNLEDSAVGEQDREDSLRLFRHTVQQQQNKHTDWSKRKQFFVQRKNIQKKEKAEPDTYYYRHRFPEVPKESPKTDGITDRIPFHLGLRLYALQAQTLGRCFRLIALPGKNQDAANSSVADIWSKLSQIGGRAVPLAPFASKERRYVSWRDFLGACTVVTRTEERRSGSRVCAFDLAVQEPESLINMILEIWFSEIAGDALRMARFAQHKAVSRPALADLRKFAAEWSEEATRRSRNCIEF